MARTVVIDELHLTVRVPVDLPEPAAEAVREVLLGDEFMDRLRRAVRRALRTFPELAPCRPSLAR